MGSGKVHKVEDDYIVENEKEIKLLYIITNGNLGGAQVHLRDLISSLPNYMKVYVIMGERLWLWDELIKLNVRLYYVDTLIREISVMNDIKATVHLKKIVNEVRPDLIHCHSSKAGFLGRIVGKMCNIPVVFTAHGWAFTDGVAFKKRMIYGMLERMAAKWTCKIICVSEYDRRLAVETMPKSKDKLVTIHNGVRDIELAQKDIGNCNCDPQNPLRLVMVARFQQPKDQPFLLKAVASLKKQNIKFFVTFIGEGPYLNEVKKVAEELGLREDVQFLGVRDDVDEILANQDVFVLISNWEGLPISILEAMRQGMPVVASHVGGVCEVVSHEETGFLIPRGELESLAQRLRELSENDKFRSKMGANGRRRFEEFFTLKTMGEQTIAVYKEVLGK